MSKPTDENVKELVYVRAIGVIEDNVLEMQKKTYELFKGKTEDKAIHEKRDAIFAIFDIQKLVIEVQERIRTLGKRDEKLPPKEVLAFEKKFNDLKDKMLDKILWVETDRHGISDIESCLEKIYKSVPQSIADMRLAGIETEAFKEMKQDISQKDPAMLSQLRNLQEKQKQKPKAGDENLDPNSIKPKR